MTLRQYRMFARDRAMVARVLDGTTVETLVTEAQERGRLWREASESARRARQSVRREALRRAGF